MSEQQFCSSCGKPTPIDAYFCPSCGSRLHVSTRPDSSQEIRIEQPARTTGVFILGLLSILILAPLGIVGWILSGKGTQQIKSGRAKHNAMFTAGKVMSIIGTAFTCVLVFF
jgi:DNA-directed RNA polymerase subunit RPC12/RpoP